MPENLVSNVRMYMYDVSKSIGNKLVDGNFKYYKEIRGGQ